MQDLQNVIELLRSTSYLEKNSASTNLIISSLILIINQMEDMQTQIDKLNRKMDVVYEGDF